MEMDGMDGERRKELGEAEVGKKGKDLVKILNM